MERVEQQQSGEAGSDEESMALSAANAKDEQADGDQNGGADAKQLWAEDGVTRESVHRRVGEDEVR